MSEYKRKATAPPPVDPENARLLKRQKSSQGALLLSEETPETTKRIGLQLVKLLQNATDKYGRFVAEDFMTLPPEDTPGYYEEIKLPVAIDTMETKLNNYQYPNLTAVEGDLKRMVANAKLYNARNSTIYEDAERLRKLTSSFMIKNNPAYRDPHFVSVPTPIPDGNNLVATPKMSNSRSRRTSQAESRLRYSESAAAVEDEDGDAENEDADGEGDDRFKGKTLHEAQDIIIEELIDYLEDDLPIFTPFINLPPRSLSDYYQVIKHPVSLKSVQNRVRGKQGRGPATGISDFPTWDAFEREVTHIWENAQTYNEDGSDMYNLAGEFEDIFKEILAEAKAVVDRAPKQTLKLKMNEPAKPSIKIKFGAKASPASTRTGTPAVGDRETPDSQRNVATNGMRPTNGRAPFSASAASGTPVPTVAGLNQHSRSASAASVPKPVNGIKDESAVQSPALGAAIPLQTPAMVAKPPQYNLPSVDGPPMGLVESKVRPNDQQLSDYLLPSLRLANHPAVPEPRFAYKVPASTESLHQSLTFTLPASHAWLRITPHVPVGLTNRPYRLFVTVNGTRASEVVVNGLGHHYQNGMHPHMPVGPGFGLEKERDKSHPVYDARLEKGVVNKIEVEILAGKMSNAPTPVEGEKKEKNVQWEKITCFVHILRR